MIRRPRQPIKIILLAGLLLAVVIALNRLAPISLIPVRPTPAPTATVGGKVTTAPWRVALPALIAQLSHTTETAPSTLPPLTSTPALPTFAASPAPLSPPLPAPPVGGSKLGVHGIRPNHILEFTRILANAGTPFRVVKAVDDLSWLIDVKRFSPTTVTVGRLTHEHEGAPLVNDANMDIDEYATILMAPILTKLQNEPALREVVDYWEVTNEPLGGGAPPDAYARLARVTIACVAIAEVNGLKLALFGFSAGTPEWVDMSAIVETGVFERAKAGNHILSLHEGVFGDDPVDTWWNTHQVDDAGNPTTENTGVTAPGGWIPGAPVLDGAGALNLRYRFLYHLLEARNEVIPLFISEFYAGGGYDPADKADLVSRLHWYDLQLATDDYVLAFAPFTLGPTTEWKDQDHESFYEGEDGLVRYMMPRAAE